MPRPRAASAGLLLAAMVVGSRGSPPTTVPLASEMRPSVLAGLADAASRTGAPSASLGAVAAGALLLGAGAARKRNITAGQKAACERAFAMLGAEDLPSRLRDDVRSQLEREQGLAPDQIDRQYVKYREASRRVESASPHAAGSPAAAASRPAAPSARASSSTGAAGAAGPAPAPKRPKQQTAASGASYINAEQRGVMTAAFQTHAASWGRTLPYEANVNPNAQQAALTALMKATGLTRSKLKYHYEQFRRANQLPLSTSLDDRLEELNERLKLADVLVTALRLAAEHPMCKLNHVVKRGVDKLRAQCEQRARCVGELAKLNAGSCEADCLNRLGQLVEIVAKHTVSESNQVRSAESALGFEVLESNAMWIKAVDVDRWLIALGDERGHEAEERTVVWVRSVMATSLYDALRDALHRTRNPVQPFPPPSEVSVGDVRAPVLYYIAGWLLNCIRRDRVSSTGVWQLWLQTNSLAGPRAAELGLPHGLVSTRSRGGLLYASWRLFHLVWYIEQCYVSALTMEAICAYGPTAVRDVHDRLASSEHVRRMFAKTFTPAYRQSARELLERAGHSADELAAALDAQNGELLRELLRMYMRMRGRDAVHQLTARARRPASHDVNGLRSSLAASASAAAVKAAKSKPATDVNVIDADAPVDEFPIDEDELEAMCAMVGSAAVSEFQSRGSISWAAGSGADQSECGAEGAGSESEPGVMLSMPELMDCVEREHADE